MSNIESNKQTDYLDYVLTIKQFFNRHRNGGYMFAVSYSYPLKKEVNKEVIDYCSGLNLNVGETTLHFDIEKTCLQQLREAKEQFKNGLILTNVDELMLLTHDEFAYQLNQMREALFALHIPILIWLSPESHSAFTHKAIDLYTRRDLNTIFFPEIRIEQDNALFERSEMQLGQEEDAETLRTRIVLLESQLEAARQDDISRKRIASEIVFPLIKAYRQLLLLDQAVELINEFKADFKIDSRMMLIEFGNVFEQVGNLEEAIEIYEALLEHDIKWSGIESGVVAFDYNLLASVLKEKGNLDKAIELGNKCLIINQTLFGERNISTANAHNNLGVIYLENGDSSQAIHHHLKALEVYEQLIGNENKFFAAVSQNIGAAYYQKGELDKAIAYLNTSLLIIENLYGLENLNAATIYSNLGLAWQDKRNLSKAIPYHEKSLLIRLKLLGDDNPDTANSYNNLGIAFNYNGNLQEAKFCYSKAHDILTKTYGSEHRYVKSLKEWIKNIDE